MHNFFTNQDGGKKGDDSILKNYQGKITLN